MQTNLCSNCICLPLCLNKSITKIAMECKLFSMEIVKAVHGHGDRGEIEYLHFVHLKRNIKLEIYRDAIYILNDRDAALIGIGRNGIWKDYAYE